DLCYKLRCPLHIYCLLRTFVSGLSLVGGQHAQKHIRLHFILFTQDYRSVVAHLHSWRRCLIQNKKRREFGMIAPMLLSKRLADKDNTTNQLFLVPVGHLIVGSMKLSLTHAIAVMQF